jgi:hypothetical protein
MSKRSSQPSRPFFKEQEKKAALSDYEQRRKVELEKTARLRALRLAKEAADREVAAEAAKVAAEKAAAKKPTTKRRKPAVASDSNAD